MDEGVYRHPYRRPPTRRPLPLGVVLLPINATLDATLDLLVCQAVITAQGSAALAKTLDDLTCAATTQVEIHATLASTLALLTASSTAQVEIHATLARTLADVTLSADGVVGSAPILADLAVTLGPLLLAASTTVVDQVAGTALLDSLLDDATLTSDVWMFDPFPGSATPYAIVRVTLDALTARATATGAADPRTTLADLQLLMQQRWDGVVFWTPEEARLAINEALSEWNLLTGHWRTRVFLTVDGGIPDVSLPGIMVYGMRIATVAGQGLIPSSLTEFDLGHPSWRIETVATGGNVPRRPLLWAPVSLTRIAIWPTYNVSNSLLCDGVMTTPVLVNPADPVDLGEEIIDYIVDMALHVVSFKEAGARWRATREYYEAFLQAAADENALLKTNQRYRRFAGLDRRRDLQPSTGASNQMQGVAAQFSRHDQQEQGG